MLTGRGLGHVLALGVEHGMLALRYVITLDIHDLGCFIVNIKQEGLCNEKPQNPVGSASQAPLSSPFQLFPLQLPP